MVASVLCSYRGTPGSEMGQQVGPGPGRLLTGLVTETPAASDSVTWSRGGRSQYCLLVEILSITIDLGPGMTPAKVESIVRAVRVAADIGRAAELQQIRRSAAERFRFPTDRDLLRALARNAGSVSEENSYRGRQLLEVRSQLRKIAFGSPPNRWLEQNRSLQKFAKGTGYEGWFEGPPTPWGTTAPGLDTIDPDLYHALVASEVGRLAPDDFVVRSISYVNPFGEELAIADQAASVVGKVAGIIETTATLGSKRKIAKADGAVAEAVVEDRIRSSRLDIALKEEALRAQELANLRAEQEVIAIRIQNARALDALDAERRKQMIVDRLIANGQLDEADAAAKMDSADVSALAQFALHPPELSRRHEQNPGRDSN